MTRATARRRRTASALVALALAGSTLAAALTAAPAAHADAWRDKEYWLAESGITKAWEVSKGANVKVAVIDSGVDGKHPDLAGVLAGGVDVSGAGSPDGQKSIGAKPEHGTLVATMLAGRGHQPADSTAKPSPSAGPRPSRPDGIVGVAPEAQLLSVSTWLGSANPGGKSDQDQIPAGRPLGRRQRRPRHQHLAGQHVAGMAAKLGRGLPVRRAEGRGDRRRRGQPRGRQRPGRGAGHHPRRADRRRAGPQGNRQHRFLLPGHQHRRRGPRGKPDRGPARRRLRGMGRHLRAPRPSWPASRP